MQITTSSTARGIALVLLAAALWGTTGTAQTFAPVTLSSYWVGTARLLIAGGFFILWIGCADPYALSAKRFKALPLSLISIAAVCMATYNLAFFAGIRTSGVAIGTAIALGSGPVWAGVLQAIWARQLPGKSWYLAVIIAVTGLTLASLNASASARPLALSGLGLCLISGLAYALYALITKRIVAVSSAATTTAIVFTGAAIVATPAAWLLAGTPLIVLSDLAPLLWLGIVATGLAYLLFSSGLQYISSATGVALALAEPIAAVFLAIVVVGERPTPAALWGILLVFVGLCLIVRSELHVSTD